MVFTTRPRHAIKQHDVVLLSEDINPVLRKGTKVVILEVYENGKAFEIEAVNPDGRNVTYKNQTTFTVSKNQIKPLE